MAPKKNQTPVTAASIIDALGGPHAVGRMLGLDIRVVSNWKTRGFPPDTYVALAAVLRKRHMAAPPELWGMRFIGND
jgi:hypothetical protein